MDTVMGWLSAAAVIGLLAYLVHVLLHPEDF